VNGKYNLVLIICERIFELKLIIKYTVFLHNTCSMRKDLSVSFTLYEGIKLFNYLSALQLNCCYESNHFQLTTITKEQEIGQEILLPHLVALFEKYW